MSGMFSPQQAVGKQLPSPRTHTSHCCDQIIFYPPETQYARQNLQHDSDSLQKDADVIFPFSPGSSHANSRGVAAVPALQLCSARHYLFGALRRPALTPGPVLSAGTAEPRRLSLPSPARK